MSTCAECKHWGAGSPNLDQDLAYVLPGPPVPKGERRASFEWKFCAKLEEVTSVSCDCSYEYSGDTVTHTVGHFGCNQFECK